MAATGYTPIQLYYSTTASATPAAGNLLSGELAINITDGKLYYKDNAGAVQLLSTSTTATGTANGVLYLNGSKVATSGSALTFDATNFRNLSGAVASGGSVNGKFRFDRNDGATNLAYLDWIDSDNGLRFYNNNGGYFVWTQSASGELMRLTSTGLGIGTSSPTANLSVGDDSTASSRQISLHGPASGTNGGSSINIRNGANTVLALGNASNVIGGSYTSDAMVFWGNAALRFYGNSAERMRLDSSGNLGLGVTPSAWGRGKAFEVGSIGNGLWSDTGSNDINAFSTNAYLSNTTISSGWKFAYGGYALQYRQTSGQHQWYTSSASGTAGAAITFTQAMTLDASGNLLLGTTTNPDGRRLRVYGIAEFDGDGVSLQKFKSSGTSIGSAGQGNYVVSGGPSDGFGIQSQTALVFGSGGNTERARIDASGNLLVGTTSVSNSSKQTIGFVGSTTNGLSVDDTEGTTTSVGYVNFSRSGTSKGSITYNNGTGLVSYNSTSDYRAKDISGPVINSGALIDSVPVYMGKMKGAIQERPMFIAHETPAYAHTGEKDAVDAEGNPVYQQMDASALIPVMWAEIQSLRARVAALES